MAYLMMKYQDPTTYALIDLSAAEFEVIRRGLDEVQSLYERLGADEEDMSVITSLQEVIERRYDDE